MLNTIMGWFRKDQPKSSNIHTESHMKQFSEEHLEQMQDRLKFLEYCVRYTNSTANASGFNVSGRQDAQQEARAYQNEAVVEIFRLKREIAALEAFLDGN